MKALAGLSGGARLLFAIALFAVFAALPVYNTVYPDTSISPQMYADLTQHPYASVLGAAFPGFIAALIAYGALTWMAHKNTSKISS